MAPADLFGPVAAAVFAWWFSTGLVLLLLRLPRRWHDGALLVLGVAALASVASIAVLARKDDAGATLAGFMCTLVVWGWNEAAFLTGRITGPRPLACPPGAVGWQRFAYATAAVLHHELALAATFVVVLALVWGTPDPVAAWTFGVLFVMRLSAKMNLFLGVPNMTDEFMPAHLDHLRSYFPARPATPLMAVSLVGGGAAAIALLVAALSAPAGSAHAMAMTLVFALMTLAVLEHVFLLVRFRDSTLWTWALPGRRLPAAAGPRAVRPARRTPARAADRPAPARVGQNP